MFRRKNRQNEIEIDLEDVSLIMGKDFLRLHVFLTSVFCVECSGYTSIEQYKIFVDDVNDIIFDGRCLHCKSHVSRYIETGLSPSSGEMARHIRYVKSLHQVSSFRL